MAGKFSIPWFMFDLSNFTFYTSVPIPSSPIKDSKGIVITEVAVPGLGYEPLAYGGMKNRKIGFTIPVIDRNPTVGNSTRLKFFEQLRNPITPLLNPFASSEFARNPKVLFNWGTGNIPLVYSVSKCDFNHDSKQVNALGFPQWTDVTMELIVDEEDFLFLGEELFRKVGAIIGSVQSVIDVVGAANNQKPY